MRSATPSLSAAAKPRQLELLFSRRRRREARARERELVVRLEAVGWAARHVLHALNNQLTVVLENARWMRGTDQDAEGDAALTDLCDSALECRALVAALQRWSKLQLRPPPEMTLGALLDEARSLLAVFLDRDEPLAIDREIAPTDEANLLVPDPGAALQTLLQLATSAPERVGSRGGARAQRLHARVRRERRSRILLELRIERWGGGDAGEARGVELALRDG